MSCRRSGHEDSGLLKREEEGESKIKKKETDRNNGMNKLWQERQW